MGYPMHYESVEEILAEIAALTPTFAGVSFEVLDREGSVQWPCNESAPRGTRVMHEDAFVRGKGLFVVTDYQPTPERATRKFPAAAHHRPPAQPVQRRGADATHREHRLAHRRHPRNPPRRRRTARHPRGRLGVP